MWIKSEKYPQITFENGIWRGPIKNDEDQNYCIGPKLLATLQNSPEFICQIDAENGKKDTSSMIADRSIRCALWLKKHGVGIGDVISVCTHNHQDTIIPVLASFYIGSILNTFRINSLDDGLVTHFVASVEPKVIFVDEESAKILKKYKINNNAMVIIVFGKQPGLKSFDDILHESSMHEIQDFQCAEVSQEQTIFIAFTSGTSGNPKAFEMSHRQMINDLNWLPSDILQESVGSWCANIGWVTVVIAMLSAVLNRSTQIIYIYVDMVDYCRIIEKFKVKWLMFAVRHVNMLSLLTNAKDFDLSNIEFVRFCGAPISHRIEKKLNETFSRAWISQTYGITEFGVITCAMRDHECSSCGIPTENVEIKLVTSTDELVIKHHEPGELYARSPHLSVIYRNDVEAGKKCVDSNGWYRTGDIACYNENGEFFLIDRIKEIIRFRTYDVPSTTIENCLLKHPGIAEVAVVPKIHDDDVEQPVAFIVRKTKSKVTRREIEIFVEKHLPDRMRLRGGVIFLDKIPYNSSDKVAKTQLRYLANNNVSLASN